MLYLGRFCMKNVVFAKILCFSGKKTAGGHSPGLEQGLYVPEMLHLTHFSLKKLKKTKNELRTLYCTHICAEFRYESNAL